MANELTVKDQDTAVREFEHRIEEFLPGAKDVPKPIRLAMAQVAIAHGLDPFLKEVWPIPQKNRDKQIVGWDLMIGIAGWRAAAWRSNEYWGRHFEKCTPDERQMLGAQPNDIAVKCIVYRRRTGQQPMDFDGYGLFRVGQEYSKMNQLQCARYRAERDAMKAAFPIGLPAGVNVKVADEETGEIINGAHDTGPQWDVITTNDAPPIEQAHDTLDELIGAAEDALRAGVLDTDQGEPERLRSAIKSTKAAARKCSIKTPLFASRLIPALAEKTTYYNDGKDAPQPYHVLGSAAKCGYSEITADNVEAVLSDLVQHAIEQTLDVPQAQA